MGVILYPVESSRMSHAGDDETRTLPIPFQSGKRDEYGGVEREVFDGCDPYRQVRTRGR